MRNLRLTSVLILLSILISCDKNDLTGKIWITAGDWSGFNSVGQVLDFTKKPYCVYSIYDQKRKFSLEIKGDYDDLFDFQEEKVLPYFEPVKKLILEVERLIAE